SHGSSPRQETGSSTNLPNPPSAVSLTLVEERAGDARQKGALHARSANRTGAFAVLGCGPVANMAVGRQGGLDSVDQGQDENDFDAATKSTGPATGLTSKPRTTP